MKFELTPQRRQYLYGLVTTILPILVALNYVDPTLVPLWLNLAGTVLGATGGGVAFKNLREQRENGTVQ
jgi:hypothetical protein